MPSFTVSEVIERTIEDVWPLVADPIRSLEWVHTAVEREFAAEPVLQKGTITRHIDRFLGRRIHSTWEVTDLEPPLYLKARTIAGPFAMEYRWDLEGYEESTSVRLTVEGEPGLGGIFGRLADAIVTQMARRQIQSDLTNLKELCEAGAA